MAVRAEQSPELRAGAGPGARISHGDVRIDVRVSVGAAVACVDDTADTLVERAGRALYRAGAIAPFSLRRPASSRTHLAMSAFDASPSRPRLSQSSWRFPLDVLPHMAHSARITTKRPGTCVHGFDLSGTIVPVNPRPDSRRPVVGDSRPPDEPARRTPTHASDWAAPPYWTVRRCKAGRVCSGSRCGRVTSSCPAPVPQAAINWSKASAITLSLMPC